MNRDMNEQLIDMPLWDRARWKGVAFGYDPTRIPFVGLAFTDGDAGIKIFNEWQRGSIRSMNTMC